MENLVYYPVLAAEIAKRGIKKKTIADALGICNRSLNNKLSGRVSFTWEEVKQIRSRFFPDMSPDELFATASEKSA